MTRRVINSQLTPFHCVGCPGSSLWKSQWFGFCMVCTQPFPPWIEQLLLEFLLAFLWLLAKQCSLTSEDLSKHVVEALIRDTESFTGLEFFIYRINIFLGCNCPQETDYTLLSQVEAFICYSDCWGDLGLYKHMDFCPAEFTTLGDRKAEGFWQTGEHNRVLKDEKWTEPWIGISDADLWASVLYVVTL